MTYNPNPSFQTWNQSLALLGDVFSKWKVKDWGWSAPRSGYAAKQHWSIYTGGDMGEWPEDLRVREFPGVRV